MEKAIVVNIRLLEMLVIIRPQKIVIRSPREIEIEVRLVKVEDTVVEHIIDPKFQIKYANSRMTESQINNIRVGTACNDRDL